MLMIDPLLGEWESGYIGTSDYQRDMRTARLDRASAAEATLQGLGLALAGSDFRGMPAPGFDVEHSTACHGSRSEWGVVPFDVRRLVSMSRRVAQTRRERRAVLALARVRASVARRAYRRTLPSAAWVTEYRTLPHTPRPLDRYSALDEWVTNRDSNRHGLDACMRAMPNRDGRGTGDTAPQGVAVNGREVRVLPRWTGSRKSDIRTWDEASGEWVAPDWTCYRVAPDGTRTALVSTATATRRKRGRPSKSRAAAVLALQSVAGNIGNVD